VSLLVSALNSRVGTIINSDTFACRAALFFPSSVAFNFQSPSVNSHGMPESCTGNGMRPAAAASSSLHVPSSSSYSSLEASLLAPFLTPPPNVTVSLSALRLSAPSRQHSHSHSHSHTHDYMRTNSCIHTRGVSQSNPTQWCVSGDGDHHTSNTDDARMSERNHEALAQTQLFDCQNPAQSPHHSAEQSQQSQSCGAIHSESDNGGSDGMKRLNPSSTDFPPLAAVFDRSTAADVESQPQSQSQSQLASKQWCSTNNSSSSSTSTSSSVSPSMPPFEAVLIDEQRQIDCPSTCVTPPLAASEARCQQSPRHARSARDRTPTRSRTLPLHIFQKLREDGIYLPASVRCHTNGACTTMNGIGGVYGRERDSRHGSHSPPERTDEEDEFESACMYHPYAMQIDEQHFVSSVSSNAMQANDGTHSSDSATIRSHTGSRAETERLAVFSSSNTVHAQPGSDQSTTAKNAKETHENVSIPTASAPAPLSPLHLATSNMFQPLSPLTRGRCNSSPCCFDFNEHIRSEANCNNSTLLSNSLLSSSYTIDANDEADWQSVDEYAVRPRAHTLTRTHARAGSATSTMLISPRRRSPLTLPIARSAPTTSLTPTLAATSPSNSASHTQTHSHSLPAAASSRYKSKQKQISVQKQIDEWSHGNGNGNGHDAAMQQNPHQHSLDVIADIDEEDDLVLV